jgi:hypothetical protein
MDCGTGLLAQIMFRIKPGKGLVKMLPINHYTKHCGYSPAIKSAERGIHLCIHLMLMTQKINNQLRQL